MCREQNTQDVFIKFRELQRKGRKTVRGKWDEDNKETRLLDTTGLSHIKGFRETAAQAWGLQV